MARKIPAHSSGWPQKKIVKKIPCNLIGQKTNFEIPIFPLSGWGGQFATKSWAGRSRSYMSSYRV